MALEAEMRKRYAENEPSVLKPPVDEASIYRTSEATIFFKKMVKWLQWVGAILVLYVLFVPVSLSFPLRGKLIAREMRTLDAKTSGELILITKSNGDYVKEGDEIGRISNPYLHQEKKRLEAETQTIETELSGIARPLEIEQKKLATYTRLYEEGDLARLRLEEEEMRVEELAGRFAVKDAEVYEHKVRLSNLEKQLEGELIISPFSGVITSPIQDKLNSHIKEGENICDVAYGDMRFEFRVKEQAVRAIEIGQKVKIRLDAFPGLKIEGRVDDIRPIVIEDNPKPWLQAYNARILVSSLTTLPKEARLGMSAKSQIRLKQKMSRFEMWLQNLF